MDIVILDGYTENPGDLSWDSLKQFGDLTIYDRSIEGDAQVIERIGSAEIVITNKTPITKAVIDACPNMKFISVLATGYNVIDYVYAREKGIPVSNVPTYGTAAVAQFTIAMLLEICHHVADHSRTVHEGKWERGLDFCYWDHPLVELDGKTMGIIGFGNIGRRTARIAKALGMKILATGSKETPEGRELAEYISMDQLLANSDVISLHCPLFPETKEIINKNTIAKMKDGVILLNTARGALIVEQDLADALNCGKVFAAACDVVSTEPIRGTNPLLSAKNCFITPHIAWAPKDSRQRIMDCTQANLKAYIDGAPQNVVNA